MKSTSRRAIPSILPDSAKLPLKRPRLKKASAVENEKSIRFQAIHAEFPYTNEEWADMWAPWIRLALVHLALDEDELKDVFGTFVTAGEAPNILEGLAKLKSHMQALADLADCVSNRCGSTLKQLGYSSENLPPDTHAEDPGPLN